MKMIKLPEKLTNPHNYEYENGYNSALDKVRKLNPNNGWISVEDRLPEDGRLVLVSGGVARLENGIWYSYTGYTRQKIIWNVTHWQPLPEPPKED